MAFHGQSSLAVHPRAGLGGTEGGCSGLPQPCTLQRSLEGQRSSKGLEDGLATSWTGCLSEAWHLPAPASFLFVPLCPSSLPLPGVAVCAPRSSPGGPDSPRCAFCKTGPSYFGAVFRFVLQLMKEFYNQTYYERNNNYINEFSLTLLWSVSVSMFPFGGFLGSLMVGPLVNKFGR